MIYLGCITIGFILGFGLCAILSAAKLGDMYRDEVVNRYMESKEDHQ